jgi:tRNA 2-thiouridine synthesizing protein A
MEFQITKTIDARGQKCPMPVLFAARGIKTLSPGEVMVIEATDGGSRSDIPAWARDTGNELIESSSENGVNRFVIRKS